MKAKIWNHSEWKTLHEMRASTVKSMFDKILWEAGFGVLDFMHYKFSPNGYTAIWLLEESHFAVHTWPEHDKMYIEMSSCSLAKHMRFLELIDDID